MKNKRKIAEKLENFLEEEFGKNIPIAILPDNSIAYKNYRIKRTKSGAFDLLYGGINFESIGKFNLKACALMAAKRHDRIQITAFNEIVDLDRRYWNNYSDTKYFEHYIKTAKDLEKYCILKSRLDISKSRTEQFKDQIQGMFKRAFV